MRRWKLVYVFAFVGILCLLLSPLLYGADVSTFTVELPTDTAAIEFTALVFEPESVVTNISYTWEDAEVTRTNGMFSGGEVVTSPVRQQIPIETVSTNAAVWTTTFPKIIPPSVFLKVDDRLDASFRRQAVADVRLSLSPAELSAVLGADFYALTLQSAQTFGSVPVQGNLETALRAVVRVAVEGDE